MNARFHFATIAALIRAIGLRPRVIAVVLLPYYALTMLSALLEGVGMMLLIGLFTARPENIDNAAVQFAARLGATAGFPDAVPFLVGVFGLNAALRFGLLSADGAINAFLRRKTQVAVLSSYLQGDWAQTRNVSVGEAVGTTTQEAVAVAKYLSSVVGSGYYAAGAVIMLGLAISTSAAVTAGLGVIALPIAALLVWVLRMQSRFSRETAVLRNRFSADMTDRLNGLLQIHVDGNYQFHLDKSTVTQSRLTQLDLLLGYCGAVLGSLTLIMPLAALLGYVVWSAVAGPAFRLDLAVVAGIGILGLRLAAQLTSGVAAVGNLSRLSGSLYPVLAALRIPPVRALKQIAEPIVRVEVRNVSYSYATDRAVDSVSMTIERGAPMVLTGRSGQGKTTLAHLIAGIYVPTQGTVHYVGASGSCYPSATYRARVGYVTQDIYLFRGTLRQSLAGSADVTDETIWKTLRDVDAAEFVAKMGGLDAESVEAGRSLSGGERRRLGIARVLLSHSEILIFDEVTAGLDHVNKMAVLGVIERLSDRYAIVVISHEPVDFLRPVKFAV